MPETSRRLQLMGTVIETKIWHEQPEPLLDQVEKMLYLYKERFSANDETSELMEVNHNAGVQPVTVSSDLYELIELGKAHSCAPNSRLNIAIGPLIQTWRVGFSDAKVPDEKVIEEKLSLTHPSDIILNTKGCQVYLKKRGMALDLGALAKGYIADKIVEYLKDAGVRSGLINLGGNVLTFGCAPHNPDGLWRIGVQDPRRPRGEHVAVLKIGEESVVTSGIYERTFTYADKTYHHIFDSKTGYPVATDVASLTIISDKSVDGEIWTTRLFGRSVQEIYDEVNAQPAIEAIVITSQDEFFYTKGIADKFESSFPLFHTH